MKISLINIGSKIKILREKSGFTQKNIADYLNVDQSLISKFEAGERPISADMLEKLAALFGLDMTCFNEAAEDFSPLSFALRAGEITGEDLEAVSAINKIALNSAYMARLLANGVI